MHAMHCLCVWFKEGLLTWQKCEHRLERESMGESAHGSYCGS